MITVTAVQLRNDLQNIVKKVNSGQEVFLSYKNEPPIKMTSTQPIKKNGKTLYDFMLKNAITKKSKKLSVLANQTPAQDKAMIHEFWDKKYMNK